MASKWSTELGDPSPSLRRAVSTPFLNAGGRKEATGADIGRALMVCDTAGVIFALVLVVLAHLLPV